MLITAVGLFSVYVLSERGRAPVAALANRRSLGFLALRTALVFLLLLAPLPYLASAYAAVIGPATNTVMWAVEKPFPLKASYLPPSTQLAEDAPWGMGVFMEDRRRARSAVSALDLRLFSYRPMVAFIALAAASTGRGIRRNGVLWAGGCSLMFALTTMLTALPVLARFSGLLEL